MRSLEEYDMSTHFLRTGLMIKSDFVLALGKSYLIYSIMDAFNDIPSIKFATALLFRGQILWTITHKDCGSAPQFCWVLILQKGLHCGNFSVQTNIVGLFSKQDYWHSQFR